MRKFISVILVTILSLQLCSCGYILHPERRGQQSGQIDWAVAGLDSIGILFFILPGVIAFAVDIQSGTIYMPKNTPGLKTSQNNSQKIQLADKKIDKQNLASAIKNSTGRDIDLENPELKIYRIQ